MDRIPGIRLGDIWPSLTWDAKVSCVKEVVGIMAQLLEIRYDSIGNLFNAKDLPIDSECTGQQVAAKSNLVVLDRIVSMGFYGVNI